MYGDDRALDLRSSLPDASVAERRQVEAKARSRKAKHDECEQDSHRALAGPVPRPDEHRALADVTVTNAHHRRQSAPLPTGGYVPVDVNHASLSAAVGVSIGAAGTAGGAVTHDGASPSPPQADDLSSFVTTGGATAAVFETASLLSAGPSSGPGTASPATESMTVTTDKADYAPGSTATFTVAGVNSGSSVAIQIADLASDPGINGIADVYAPFSVTDGGTADADGLANGAVVAKWQVPADGSATGAVLQLTAVSGSQTATTTFSDTPNQVVLENQKPGNPESEWGIDGAGSSNIEGFATDISTNRGQTVNFKINTNSNNYRIDIYRLGYYGGMGARKVDTIQHTGVQSQPTPLRDSTTGLVDAGNWSVSASWAVPADAVSGVYIAKLVRQDGTAGENQIPFIVRDDSSHSDVIFQTSDETWQAYNPWGGANLYQGNGPGGDSAPGRAYAVSYNRPITTRGGGLAAGPQDYIFGVEFPAIQWLEKNGYDVSYMAGMDSDRLGNLIQNHRLFLSVGHDEYWSGQQRANVEAARDAGVNLSFWSGNEVYWETRFAPSISAGAQPYRTLVSYKETRAGPIDPSNQWTGTYRDPRFVSPTAVGGGRPENALSGTMFQVDSYRSDAITIPYDDANLRFWRNTNIANLQPGQTATLTQNYLGYEWDESPDNGFRPAGLIELSSTTLPVNEYLLDYGTVTGSATATHNLTLYRAPSGALVFGAGTVYWAWGLDANHDLEATPVDPRVKQAMVNLLADMGIQPGTLEAGLVSAIQSTDATKPVSTITAPNDGTALRVGNAVTISGTASDVGGVVAAVEVSTDGGTTWHRAVGDETWSYSWVAPTAGTFTIKSRAVDDSVNLETAGAGRTVTVTGNNFFSASATPPIVPDADAKSIEVGMKFQSSMAGTVTGVRYYKSDLNIGPHTGSLWSSTGTRLATVTFTNESGVGWQTASFSTPVAITAGTTYVVSYHTNYGHYAATGPYFASPVTNGPLTAPTNAGVYTYNSASTFPSSTFNAENYWVDVLFNPGANAAPTAVADTANATEKGGIANGSGGSSATGNVLTNDTDPDAGDTKTVTAVKFGATNGTVGTALAGAHGSLVLNAAGAFTYTVNETDAAVQALRQSTDTLTDAFSYTMRDAAGATSTASLTVSIHGANDAPVLAIQTGGQNAVVGSLFSLALPAGTFTDVDAGDTLTYTPSQPAWLTFAPATRTFSGTPAAADVGTLGITVSATDLGGLAASETFNIVVTTTPDAAPTAVADAADATEKGGIANGSGGSPASGNVLTNDTDPDAGDTKTVTAVSFGAVAGTLGTALAGAHGSLVLNAAGDFTYTVNDNDAAVQGLRQSTDTLTDAFSYTMRDAAGVTSTTSLTVRILGANDAPTLAVQTSGQNAVVGSAFSLVLPGGTFTDVDAGDTLTYAATAADGSPLPAWLAFNAATRTFSGTPAAANVGTLSVKATATDLGSLAAIETFNIAVAPAPLTVSLFTASNTPAQTDLNDGQQLEVGMKFQSSVAGQITALKFYRSASDTGADILDLWTTTGTNLASVTFTNTAASGWQTVSLTTPVAISANTTYVASYHTTGFYVATDNFFTTAFTSGVLTAPSTTTAGGNGVYAYGGTVTAGIFPTNTYGAANYWADVVFASSAANTPTATNLSAAESYTEDTPLNLTDIVVSDVDSANVTATLTLSNPAAGSLSTASSGAVTSTYTVGTGVWTASGAIANVNALLAGVTFTPTANFNSNFTVATSVSDGALATTGTKAFNGTAVNDAPTATNLSAAESYTEDTPLNLTDIVVSDVDSANVTATLTLSNPAAGSLTTATSGAVTSTYTAGTGVWTASGAIANVNALLAGVTFTPTANFNSNFTVATSVSDGALATTGTKAFNGTAVNDAPTATNLSAAESYTEDTPLNLTDIVVSDVDSANVTATLTLSNPAAGSLSTASSGAVTSTYTAGTGVWTASGAIANVNALLAGVTFTPTASFNSNFTVATSVSDGLAPAITGTKAFTGTTVNAAPVAINLSAAESYTEDTPLNLIDIVVSDADSANVTATMTLSNVTAGSLTTATSGAVTSTYIAGTGVWTASGAIADVNALLAGVAFTPTADFNGSFSIATSVSDGVAPAITGSKAFTGTAVNDAPTISNLAVSATSISFVASDPDNATLSLASPFASAFGNPLITSGATTSLTPSAQTTAVSGTLQVTDGSATAEVVGLYLGTGGSNTATAPNPTAPNAMYGFGGIDTLTGGAAADSIFGGAGAETLSGGAGNDTFYLANGDFASGESIGGGADADAIVLTNSTTVNFATATISSVETLTGSSGNDTVTMSTNQWAGFSAINLGSGTNVLNVVASGDISAQPTPTVSNVTTGNLTGTSGNETLTGAQLDAIIIGAGTINLGAGTDTINLTSTSADLNALGATNASIQGVEAISAATAGSGVTITLSGQTEGFTITGSANNDTITGGRGADTITGGAGVDRFVFNSASSPGTVGGSGDTGTVTGYDVITDFSPNAGGDVLDMPNLNVRGNETINGTDSALTIAGQQIKSHQINNGIITFSNNDTFSSGTTFSLTSLANVAAAVDYIHRNDFATNTGANIGFVANIAGTLHTHIFNQVGNKGNTTNDILVDLVGVSLTTLSGANLAPAGVAGEAINLGLTNPTNHLGSITVNISGVPSGWTVSEGSGNGDGTWSVQTYDASALSITAPENYAGAVSLQMSQTWTDATGGTGLAMINNNVEAYASGAPIFAISGDDNLSGSSENDVFVLAQPIGNDTIHSFDFAHDKVDLIGFNGLSSFVDVQTCLSENSNGDAVITIAQGGSITFDGVSAAALTADNFVFNRNTVMDNANSIVIGDNAVLPLAGTIKNIGTIELTSIGGQARLQVLANGLTLEGGGRVDLSDGNGNIIVGTTLDATLTNVDNTISGAGQLGEGQLTLHNKGTIIASGSNALIIDTGANEVVNSGTLRATGSGGLVIHSDIANSGLLWANGGNITTDGNVSGTGSALIDGVATFEMAGAFSENVTLDASANATLKIDHAADFRGTLAGFDSNDVLDLADLAFGSSTTLGYAANSNNTGGALTASDGTHTATIALLGQYTAASFVMSADGFGGTLIHDVAPATLTHTLTQPQHA